MKTARPFLISLAVLGGLTSSPLAVFAATNPGDIAITYLTNNSHVRIQPVRILQQRKAYSTAFVYPQFISKDHALNVQPINRLLKTEMRKTFDKMREDMPAELSQGDSPYVASSGFSATILPHNIAALSEGFYEFTGGAHGNPWMETYNFDLLSGKRLMLKDLFQKMDLQLISELCRIELYKELADPQDEFIAAGTEPLPANFQNFTITREGIEIAFQPYQVAPYCDGEPTVTLPFSVIKPLLNKQTPVYQLAENVKVDPSLLTPEGRKQQLFDAMKKALDRRVAEEPQDADVYVCRGDFLLCHDRFALAAQDYSRALWHDPDHREALLGRGRAYLKLGKVEPAVTDFSHAVAVHGDAQSYYLRGIGYSARSDYDEAVSSFSSALQQSSRSDIYLARAKAYEALGKHQDAMQDIDHALSKSPANSEAQRLRVLVSARLNNQ